MTIFYSPSLNAFFDDAVHGARTIWVEDDDARNAALAQLTASEDEIEEEDEQRAERQEKIDEARRKLLSEPPLKEVANPDCRLPEDAVEISAEHHAKLINDQAKGWSIIAGSDGMPWQTLRSRTDEEVLTAARVQRDRALAASDWTQLPDALDAAKRKAWAAHRKHLRELPKRIEELIAKGKTAEQAAELVQRNVAATAPAGDA